MRVLSLLSFALATSLVVLAAPAASPALPTQDAPFSDTPAQMDATIECPNGIQGKAGGVVLLVSGTALNGRASYEQGPFVQLLPSAGPGFDVCWVSPPANGLADAQTGGEYVAYAIKKLAKQSATGKVKVGGHSQGGGLDVPWALIFFPSARKRE